MKVCESEESRERFKYCWMLQNPTKPFILKKGKNKVKYDKINREEFELNKRVRKPLANNNGSNNKISDK